MLDGLGQLAILWMRYNINTVPIYPSPPKLKRGKL
jgi:hypothetical protein